MEGGARGDIAIDGFSITEGDCDGKWFFGIIYTGLPNGQEKSFLQLC